MMLVSKFLCCFLGFFGVHSIKLKYDYAKFEFAYTLADLSASFVRNQNESAQYLMICFSTYFMQIRKCTGALCGLCVLLLSCIL